jgi:hypothetical protein
VSRLRWFIPVISLLLGTANAQVCDPLRWGNASSWKGTFTVNGNGSGSLPIGCPNTYTATQAVTGTPTLTGAFSNWSGTMNAQPSMNITDVVTCPPPQASCTVTIVGNTVAFDDIHLGIDTSSCRYSIFADGAVNTTGTDSCGGTAPGLLFWGPLVGPDGSPAGGLAAANLLNTGVGVIDLPATGVDLSYTVPPFTDVPDPFAETWNINWKFSPKCVVQLPNKYGQGQSPWGTDPYGGKSSKTLGALGCALTSLTMAMQYAYGSSPLPPEFTNPGNLNISMTTASDFDKSAVSWDRAARHASNNKLKFDSLGGFVNSVDNPIAAKQVLDYALCSTNPHPVIIGVKLAICGPTGCPGHFVIVTGRDEDGHYTIVDPADGSQKNLDSYANEFSTRGIVRDPPGDISALDIDTGDNVTLLVTDAIGNRTGTDPTSGSPLQQIPGSAYFIDRVDDDITGEIDTQPAHMVLIPTPKPGTYTIVAQGLNSGPYTISISSFSQDGSPQPPIVFTGNAIPGSTTTYTINYVSTPGATSVVNFSALAAKAEITQGGFEVRGSFTLGTGSAGISPDTQPVTLTLGRFTTTIPAGSFKRHRNGHYELEGTINGVRLEFEITPIGGNSFRFSVEAHDVNLAASTNPVPFELLIGSDGGTTQANNDD